MSTTCILLSHITNNEISLVDIKDGPKPKFSDSCYAIDLNGETLDQSKVVEKGTPTVVEHEQQMVDVRKISKDDPQKPKDVLKTRIICVNNFVYLSYAIDI